MKYFMQSLLNHVCILLTLTCGYASGLIATF